MRVVGIFGLVVGAIWAIVAFNMDTSVPTPYGQVNNIGLMNAKQNHLMMSLGLVVVSVLLVLFGRKSDEVSVGEAGATLSSDDRLCPFCAETIKRAAIKCKHCGSDVPAQIEEAPAPITSFFECPAGMPLGEYHDELISRYNLTRHGSGFKWRDKEFSSMTEVIAAIRQAVTKH